MTIPGLNNNSVPLFDIALAADERYDEIFRQYDDNLSTLARVETRLFLETIREGGNWTGYGLLAGLSELGAKLKLCRPETCDRFLTLSNISYEMMGKNWTAFLAPSRTAVERQVRSEMVQAIKDIGARSKELSAAERVSPEFAKQHLTAMLLLLRASHEVTEEVVNNLDDAEVQQVMLMKKVGIDITEFYQLYMLYHLTERQQITSDQQTKEMCDQVYSDIVSFIDKGVELDVAAVNDLLKKTKKRYVDQLAHHVLPAKEGLSLSSVVPLGK